MIPILESLLPIFALIALGLFLRRRGIVPEEQWDGLGKICYWLFFPALLAQTMIRAELDDVPLSGMLAVMLASIVTIALVTLFLRPVLARFWGMRGPAYTSVFQTSTRWNGFIALAVVLKLFGDQGVALVAVAMAVMVPVINFENVLVLAAFSSDKRPPVGRVVVTVLRNPLIWGCLTGLAINRLDVPVWDPALTLVDLLGRAGLGAGLLCVGAGLKVKLALKPSRAIWLTCFLKLALMPLIVGAFALWFGLRGDAFEVAILCAAVPTALNGYILARQMGGDADLYAAAVTVQTALSLITIPILLLLAERMVAFL